MRHNARSVDPYRYIAEIGEDLKKNTVKNSSQACTLQLTALHFNFIWKTSLVAF